MSFHDTIKPSTELLLGATKCGQCEVAVCGAPALSKVFGHGKQTARIAIVGESPTAGDVTARKLFSGGTGKLIDAVLDSLGMRRDQLYFASSLLCSYKSTKKPGKKSIEACRGRLELELSRLPNLDVVIAMGGMALQALTDKTAITKEIYNVYWNDRIQAFVVPVYHPAFVFRNIEAFDDLVWAFRRA